MRDFMHGTSAKVLLAVVFVMLALMLFTATQGGSVVANALGLVATPMQRVSTIITNNAAVAAEPLTYSKEELLEENAALKKEIEELQAKLVNYDQYRIENAQLRKYLELKDENRDFKPVPAAVIGRDPNVLYKFTIDKGTNDGISKNDPVITDAGVVGFISAVNANYSQVTTLLSPDTKIAALVKMCIRDRHLIDSLWRALRFFPRTRAPRAKCDWRMSGERKRKKPTQRQALS